MSRGIAEDDPVLGTPGLQGEEQRLDEGRPPKKPPEGYASRMGPTCGYSAKLVQGKYVPFTHYVTPFFRPKAYKVRVRGVSPQCGIEQIRAGGT